jgi:NADH:ubiquinone oxidoreductase subunit 5 (subunit L)/multisubunit Na+/H+ antiporter MnhA subunit
MFRLMGKTFYGPSHVEPAVAPKVHESPVSMTLPLILLAIPSLLLGLAVGFPPADGLLHGWLEPVFHHASEVLHIAHHPFELFGIDGYLLIVGAGAGALGVALGIWYFGLFGLRPRPARVEAMTARLRPLYVGSSNLWWFDRINDAIFVRFGGLVARALWWIDVRVIDGAVNGVAGLTQQTGRGIRRIQTGRVQNYALGIAAGLLVIAVSYLFLVR